MATRIEHDSMGELQVPANALYQAQTQLTMHWVSWTQILLTPLSTPQSSSWLRLICSTTR